MPSISRATTRRRYGSRAKVSVNVPISPPRTGFLRPPSAWAAKMKLPRRRCRNFVAPNRVFPSSGSSNGFRSSKTANDSTIWKVSDAPDWTDSSDLKFDGIRRAFYEQGALVDRLRSRRLRGGSAFTVTVPPQLRRFLKQPIAEGNDLAPRFVAGRLHEPVAGQHRHNVIDRNGKTARRKIVVDQRQAADRDAKPVRRRFERQL